METKSIILELKDISPEKRTAVIAHAVYNNIDRTKDISTKGMFNSSWSRGDSIDFYKNHDDKTPVGNVKRTFEDEQKAYTEVKFGDWTEGNDLFLMADANVLKGASFGYETEKKEWKMIKGEKIRVLTQVKHIETSLLTVTPANPLAGIVQLNKAFEEWKTLVNNLRNFIRNTTASDETIQAAEAELKQLENIISRNDTATTPLIMDGAASVKEFNDALYGLSLML